MAAGAHRPAITPTLVLCLGDFGERGAQALAPEIAAAGPAVAAAVRWLRLTWPEAGGVRLTDDAGRVLLETGEDDPEAWATIRSNVEQALRSIGLHATREQLLQAGYRLPADSPASRRVRYGTVEQCVEAAVAGVWL